MDRASISIFAAPADSGSSAPARRRVSREGKTLAGAWVTKPDLAIIQELCIRLGRERGSTRVTMQEFALEALRRECERHGVKLTGDS